MNSIMINLQHFISFRCRTGGYMEKKLDRRTAYTRMVIRDSLYELLKTKHLPEITVKELCELADINRATFYRNYLDIYDLFEKIEAELVQNAFSSGNIQDDRYTLLELIYANKDFYREFFSSRLESPYIKRTIEAMYLQMETFLKSQGIYDAKIFPILYQYNYYGFIGTVQEWLKNGCIQPPKEFGDIIYTIIEKQYQ